MELLATRFDVQSAIGDEPTVIVDVRRESEYRGTERRARRAGTVPGAVHVFWRDHLDAQGALRPAEDIRALYESKGVTPDKTINPFCQGGYRSANTFLALKSLGYPRAQLRRILGRMGQPRGLEHRLTGVKAELSVAVPVSQNAQNLTAARSQDS